jgi:potassium efflux system protein
VFLNEFNSSSIDFRLLFWSDINNWLVAKSEVILSVDTAFREQGIQIPFPQQDIYIKEIPKKDSDELPN